MKAKKAALWTIVIVAALLLVMLLVYRHIQQGHWLEEHHAVQTVTENVYGLQTVSEIEQFTMDKHYTIIYGTKDDQPAIVWSSDDEIQVEYASSGVSKDQVRGYVQSAHPEAEVLRVTAGKWEGQLVWEAFYKLKQPEGERYYYDFYLFKNGQKLDTFTLSKR
ncbi:hypothetical protein [Paenibacillus sp. y28]|uniref:hypothetical protein n=1 Tax=Paenibacillus sp. y28 TaxID=3129110 RepID=UPI003017508E